MTRTPAQPSGHHTREHFSLLADSERRALIWIAGRLPARINSDHLSMLALLSMLAAGVSFASFRVTPWAALGVIVSLLANWFGDSLDGTVARVRGQQRPRYGFYVDHVIDLAGTALLLAGLACSGLMNPTLAVTLLAAYLLVAAESYLTTHAAGIFRLSFLGFGPTELRIVLALGALKVASSPWIALGGVLEVRLFDLGGIVAIAGLALAFIVSAVRNTIALYAADPRPAPADQRRAA
jgi:archaetidylinositol phosphate synthase